MIAHILESLQFIACLVLAVAAVCRRFSRPVENGTYRHLLPFIIAAAFLGWVLVVAFANEVFTIWYSGAMYEVATEYRILGWPVNIWGAMVVSFFLMILPAAALFPALGKRPVVVAILAILALVPSAFALFGN